MKRSRFSYEARCSDGPAFAHYEFMSNEQWPKPSWRKRTDGYLQAIRDAQDLEVVIRSIAAGQFLADQPVLSRWIDEHGHFYIAGERRRVCIVGIASEQHGDGLRGKLRDHLLSLVTRGAKVGAR